MRFLLERRFRPVHRVQEPRPLSQVGQGHHGDEWAEHAKTVPGVHQHNVAWIPWKSAFVVDYPGTRVVRLKHDKTDKECTRRRHLPLGLSYRLQQHEWKDPKVQGQLRHAAMRSCNAAELATRNSRKQGRRNSNAQMPLPQQLASVTPQRHTPPRTHRYAQRAVGWVYECMAIFRQDDQHL